MSAHLQRPSGGNAGSTRDGYVALRNRLGARLIPTQSFSTLDANSTMNAITTLKRAFSRAIVVFVDDMDHFRAIASALFNNGMFGVGYAFLCSDFFYSSTLLSSSQNHQVFLGSLVFRYGVGASDFVQQNFALNFANRLSPCPDSDASFCTPIQRSPVFAFDAMNSIVGAIVSMKSKCINLAPGVSNNAILGTGMMQELRNISFVGVSGPLSFVASTNDRLTSSALPIYNVNAINFLSNLVAYSSNVVTVTSSSAFGVMLLGGSSPILWPGSAAAGGAGPTFRTYYVGMITQANEDIDLVNLALHFINTIDTDLLGVGSGDAIVMAQNCTMVTAGPSTAETTSNYARVSVAAQSLPSPLVAIFGGMSTAGALDVSQFTARDRLPFIDAYVQGSIVSDKVAFPYFIRSRQSSASKTSALLSTFQNYGWRSYVLIHGVDAFGIAGMNDCLQLSAAYGITISQKIAFDPSSKTVTNQTIYEASQILQQVRANSTGPILVMMWVQRVQAQMLMNAAHTLGMSSPNVLWAATLEWYSSSQTKQATLAARRSFVTIDSLVTDSPGFTRFRSRVIGAINSYLDVTALANKPGWGFADSISNYAADSAYFNDAAYLLAAAIGNLKRSQAIAPSQIPFRRDLLMSSLRSTILTNMATGDLYYPTTGPFQNDRQGNPRSFAIAQYNNQTVRLLGYCNATFFMNLSAFFAPFLFADVDLGPQADVNSALAASASTRVPGFCYGGTSPIRLLEATGQFQTTSCVPCAAGTSLFGMVNNATCQTCSPQFVCKFASMAPLDRASLFLSPLAGDSPLAVGSLASADLLRTLGIRYFLFGLFACSGFVGLVIFSIVTPARPVFVKTLRRFDLLYSQVHSTAIGIAMRPRKTGTLCTCFRIDLIAPDIVTLTPLALLAIRVFV
jgi:hypothetical protein